MCGKGFDLSTLEIILFIMRSFFCKMNLQALCFLNFNTLGFMEDQPINQCSSSTNASEKTPESTLELNIKTLDSRTYTFQVNKNVRNLLLLLLHLHICLSLVCLYLILLRA